MQRNFNCIYFVFLSFVFVVDSSSDSDPFLGIVGGRNVQITQAPWQVHLEMVLGPGLPSHLCGGAIVNKEWILTAAHCTSGADRESVNVRVGSTYRDRGGQVIPAKSCIIHGKFNRTSFLDYDFSLLKLNEPIYINNSTTKAISLPNPTDTIHANSRCFVTGWGLTNKFDERSKPDKLQGLEVSIVSHSSCQNTHPNYITDRMICAAPQTGGKSACSGDSGGPLLCETVDGLWKQFGIVSFSRRCGDHSPNVYSRVQSVRSWIRKYTGS